MFPACTAPLVPGRFNVAKQFFNAWIRLLDRSVSGFGRRSSTHYLPDVHGELAFNGVASDVRRQSQAAGLQADASYRLNANNTLRFGAMTMVEQINAAVLKVMALPETRERMAAAHPLGRLGRDIDIANAVAFLASAASGYCQGAILDIDGGQTDLGLFNASSATVAYQVADFEYADSIGADDNLIGVAKATIQIPAGEGGEWTFGVHSDDGFALRIDGGVFQRVSGGSFIDPALRDTVYFRFGTGNSDARAVVTLSEGPHKVDFIWFEGTGGSYFELYAARGGFNNDGDTGNWRLVGGPEGLALTAATTTDPGFVITNVTAGPNPGEITLSFPSTPGVIYGIEYDLDLAGVWPSAGTVTGAAGTTTTVTLNPATLNGGTAPTRIFFRVRRP